MAARIAPRRPENRYDDTAGQALTQTQLTRLKELGSMYDYLAKIILLGPSGSGK